jgi:hypothetical protein
MTATETAPRITGPLQAPEAQRSSETAAIVEIVAPINIDELAEAFHKFQQFKDRLLSDEDAVQIQGRRVVKRGGWAKWRLACNVSDRIIEQERTPRTGRDPDGHFSWRVVTEVSHRPTGRSSVGVAICSSSERKNSAREEHDVYSTAATRSKNRATSDLIGGGELSAEELETDTPGPSQAASRKPPKQQAAPSTWTDTSQ